MESEEEGAGDASGALFASTLPSECWAHIFSFLNGPALARCATSLQDHFYLFMYFIIFILFMVCVGK
jgi:hypothetical protein